jgi:hypothetical protein
LYSPPIVGGLMAFKRFYKEYPKEALLFACIALVYLVLYGSFKFWHGAGCWGPRYLEPVIPFLIIPAAYLFEKKSSTYWLGFLTVFGIGISLLGVVVNPVYAEQWRGLWGGGVLAPFQDNAYFYVPSISPPVIHFDDFFAGRNWDLWVQFVLHEHGRLAFLGSIAVPIVLFVVALRLLQTALANLAQIPIVAEAANE